MRHSVRGNLTAIATVGKFKNFWAGCWIASTVVNAHSSDKIAFLSIAGGEAPNVEQKILLFSKWPFRVSWKDQRIMAENGQRKQATFYRDVAFSNAAL